MLGDLLTQDFMNDQIAMCDSSSAIAADRCHYFELPLCAISRHPRSWKTDKTESVTRRLGDYLGFKLRTKSFVNIDPFPASRFAVMHQQDGLLTVIEYNYAE